MQKKSFFFLNHPCLYLLTALAALLARALAALARALAALLLLARALAALAALAAGQAAAERLVLKHFGQILSGGNPSCRHDFVVNVVKAVRVV